MKEIMQHNGIQPDKLQQKTRMVEVNGMNFELIKVNDAVTMVNIEKLLPETWRNQLMAESLYLGEQVQFEGGAVSTSKENPDFITSYAVVDGSKIKQNIPWLYDAWKGPIAQLVAEVAGEAIVPDDEADDDGREFGINVNVMQLQTQKDGYEWHVDFNEWTGLLAGTDINPGDGGELLHKLSKEEQEKLNNGSSADDESNISHTQIKAGYLYIFPGRKYDHKVTPLNKNGSVDTRITVPMDYNTAKFTEVRPKDLNGIFGGDKTNDLAGVHDIYIESSHTEPTNPVSPGRKAS